MADDALREMYRDGQIQWPSLHLDFEVFRRHCERHHGLRAAAVVRHAPDLFLCCACATGVPGASEQFRRVGSAVAEAAIARINRDREFVSDTLQVLWGKLLVGPKAKVQEYSGRGPLQAWLRVAAARGALDRQRSLKVAERRSTELTRELVEERMSPESALTRTRYAGAFQAAMDAAVASLSPRDRNLLRMHVVGRCSIDQIGRAYGVHRATAARWLDQLREGVFAAVRQELALGESALTDSEFRSIARIMQNELELSLSIDASDIEELTHRQEGGP